MLRCVTSFCTRTNCSIQKPDPNIKSEDSSSEAATRGGLYRLIRERFVPHWQWFAAGTVCAAFTSFAAASYGYLLKLVVEGLEQLASPEITDVPNSLWWLIGVVGVAAAVRALSLYGMTMLNNTGVQRAIVDVQTVQFDALTRGDYARLAGDASGGFVSRFINDVNALREAGLRLANNLTKGVLTVVGVLITMLIMDWKLTLVLLLVYPLAFGPVIALGNRVRKRAKQAQQQVGEVTALLSEGFQSARIVKAYGLEDYQGERAKAGFIERSRLFLKVLSDKAAVDPVLEVTGGLALVGVLGLTAWRIADGDTSLGNFVGIIGAIAVAAPELRALGTLNAVAQEGGAAADRIFTITDAAPRVAAPSSPVALGKVRGEIRFDDVHFGYSGGQSVLNGLSFTAAPGETIALVGPSGAGKSTVFNLLMRLYDPNAGVIRLDAKDISALEPADLRRALALVSQDAMLFDDTVAANIQLGRFDAQRDEIEVAAQAAHAHAFIEELSDGYETRVGEMGSNLSGGQRQRVSLARAVLRDAPVLLLDEATSALDAESESRVQAALELHAKDRTTLIIAHRLSTVRNADRILLLEGGRVVESGTHDELIAKSGSYAKLAALQLQ